jgi:hypothetical protein
MYDYAQTFFIDKAKVRGSPQVNISRVDLYFKQKPKAGSGTQTNKSGILNPGVEVSIVNTKKDGTPDLTDVLETTRLEYGDISVSGNATQETRFTFEKEVYLQTDKTYAIYIRFDGMEDYVLWTNRKGFVYVGTNIGSPGVTDKLIGNLYKTRDRLTADFDPDEAGGPGSNQGVDAKASWVAMVDEDLKFEVFVARYRDTGTSNTANSSTNVQYALPSTKYEYVLFDAKHSKKEAKAHSGERIFQLNPLASNNGNVFTVSVQRGNTSISSPSANFSSIFTTTEPSYIVLVSAGQDPGHISDDTTLYNVGRVIEVDGNTVVIDRAPTFTNSSANFIVSPVAEVEFLDKSRSFNARFNSPSWYWSDRQRQDLLVMKKSNANITHRFVNNSIQSITITANGGGYSNTNYLVISSSSANSINAFANVRTNASGNITAVFMTNAGAGMIATPTVTVRANSTHVSPGVGATFSLVEGPWLKSEIKKYVVKDVEVIDFEIDAVTSDMVINNPGGTSYDVKHQLAYIKAANGDYIINQSAETNQKLLKNFKKNGLPYANTPSQMSRSNEVIQLQTVTGNSSVIVIDAISNNDFIDPCPNSSFIYYHRHVINNDYTNEHTSYGNAAAKHITKKITFAEGRLAEDSIVYLRAYRPPGTDFKVYNKLYNSQDPEAFDDKDWTLMECTAGADQVSSLSDNKDIREFTYGIPLSPNTAYLVAGTVKLESDSTTVTGTGTSFLNELTGVKAGDLVKIYDPLFADQKYFISSVNSVSSGTILVLDDSTSNVSLIGEGLKLAKLQFKNQAFRNLNNDNVVRYYNTSMHVYDGYDTMAIKIVMLSSSTTVIPEVEDVRAIGVSA